MEKDLKDYLDKNFAKLVTKEEVKEQIGGLRADVNEQVTGLRAEMKAEVSSLRTEMKSEIGGLRTEMKAEINGLRNAMKTEAGELRTEMKDMEDRVIHKYHITAKALRDDIKQVAEGVMNLNEKFDREMSQFRKEMAHSHDELKAMIKFSYSELDRRITTLEIELENLKHRIEKIERGSSIS